MILPNLLLSCTTRFTGKSPLTNRLLKLALLFWGLSFFFSSLGMVECQQKNPNSHSAISDHEIKSLQLNICHPPKVSSGWSWELNNLFGYGLHSFEGRSGSNVVLQSCRVCTGTSPGKSCYSHKNQTAASPEK